MFGDYLLAAALIEEQLGKERAAAEHSAGAPAKMHPGYNCALYTYHDVRADALADMITLLKLAWQKDEDLHLRSEEAPALAAEKTFEEGQLKALCWAIERIQK